MFDIWGFLLQTLTVSGVAILLLIIKALFRDKLPPKWHFAVWSVLGVIVLCPAGFGGRYILFNWRIVVESVKILAGDYSTTRVLFPFPYINSIPDTLLEWVFAVYVMGMIIYLLKYLISYIRLRSMLHKGNSPADETVTRINNIAEKYNIKPCKVIEISGLPSAFVCGIIKPVLVLPADKEIDDKIILHELLHLKYKDTFWSIVICLLRSVHWCNPLISYCANRAINDMESRCDQHVLELLEGEERRDYGQILLSMSNERFSKTPGSTCINNGGKNIRERIEAIARFKKYPIGMSLVSVCIIVALCCSLVVGVQAMNIPEEHNNTYLSFVSAKSTFCTTPAGAFDTYAKAVMRESRNYRIMCAPENMQAELISSKNSTWECGLSGYAESSNYYIYNIEVLNENTYEGLLVIKLVNEPDGREWEEGKFYVAHQKIRVFKENGRWVTVPLSDFGYVATENRLDQYGCMDLPAITYTNTVDDYKVDITSQTIYIVDNETEATNNNAFSSLYSPSWHFNNVPIPNAEFTEAYDSHETNLTHLGTQEERDLISQIGISVAPVYSGEEKPEELDAPMGGNASGSSSNGTSWETRTTEPGWGPSLLLAGGGGGGTFDWFLEIEVPEYYVADLYINNELYTQMELHLQEEAE